MEIPWIHRDHVHQPFDDRTWHHLRQALLTRRGSSRAHDRDRFEADLAHALDDLQRRAATGHTTRAEQTVLSRAQPARIPHPTSTAEPSARAASGPRQQPSRPDTRASTPADRPDGLPDTAATAATAPAGPLEDQSAGRARRQASRPGRQGTGDSPAAPARHGGDGTSPAPREAKRGSEHALREVPSHNGDAEEGTWRDEEQPIADGWAGPDPDTPDDGWDDEQHDDTGWEPDEDTDDGWDDTNPDNHSPAPPYTGLGLWDARKEAEQW
ncbi:hypothetical protein [Kitasatospora phosalacinea]|uniref:Uncharacterized protein n=1 Tax=Kitasatospora phosalacinea TaxID=2065 RepID=A0ABW6GLJ6_9ACTN